MVSPPPLPEALEQLLEEFRMIDDVETRMEMLVDYDRRFRTVPGSIAQPPYSAEHRVPNCESQAYCFAEPLPDHTIRFHFAVENPQGITARAFAAILSETLSGAAPVAVAAVPDTIVFDIFGRELSMAKGLGLRSMVQCVTSLARRAQ